MNKEIRPITKKGKVYYKTNGHCAYCGELLDPFEHWHTDHILPKSKGGGNNLDNLYPACMYCNLRKKDRTPEEWKQFILKKHPEGTVVQFYYERFLENKDYLDDPFVEWIED